MVLDDIKNRGDYMKMRRSFILALFFISIIIGQFGCATTNPHSYTSPIPENVRKSIKSVAIVPPKQTPELKAFVISSYYKPDILGLLLTGMEWNYTGYKSEEYEEPIPRSIKDNMDLSENISECLKKSGHEMTDHKFEIYIDEGFSNQSENLDLSYLKNRGNDIVVKISKIEWSLLGKKSDNPMAFLIIGAEIKVIDVNNQTEIYSYTTGVHSNIYLLSSWLNDEKQLFKKEFDRNCRLLGRQIIEYLFLVHNFFVNCDWIYNQWCVIEPVYPMIDMEFPWSWAGQHKPYIKYSEVSSLKPTLSWNAFPSESDKKYDKKNILNKVSDIRYDLKIWWAANNYTGKLVYYKENIQSTYHQVETNLEPSTQYLWSVRARFKFDNEERFTRWAYSGFPFPMSGPTYITLDHIAIDHHFRFRTP